MKFSIATLASVAAITALTACASPSAPEVASTAPAKKCVPSLGSHVCRDESAGTIANVRTISGDELRQGYGAGSGSGIGGVGN
jgi:hypothetical protein